VSVPAARFVALVRGINVGRAKRVAMADLRAVVADLGYRDVRTLLNSGNVVFGGGDGAPGVIARKIESRMLERLAVAARVQVLTAADFAAVVKENALVGHAVDPARLLVAFCDDPRRLREAASLQRQDWAPEAMAVGRLAAYLWCPAGILAGRLLEAVGRVLGETTTTRNWATVKKIEAALEHPTPSSSSTSGRTSRSRERSR
jgi:uncharacterized protein (DUF1697 family)